MAKKKSAKNKPVKGPWWKTPKTVYALIAVVCFALYANTLGNEYALDDAIAITSNSFTKNGFSGIPDLFKYDTFTGFFGTTKELVAGGRYRPLSLVTFAIEWQLFGENPGVSHFINILLYALTGMILWQLLMRFRAEESNVWFLSLPLVVVLLFLAHPLHTEVVANIKGRDDIMALLGALLAWKYSLDYLEGKGLKYGLFSGLALFAGLLSKENAITFLAVIPMGHYFFTKNSIPKIAKNWIPLILGAVVFLAIRYAVIGFPKTEVADELMNNPFLGMTGAEKYGTIIYTLGIYLKLLFFPHPLTYDYYPYHIPITGLGDLRFIISALLYVGLGVFALIRLPKRDAISFGILYFFATMTIVSNLFFPIGVFMNERFAYMASVGWAIAFGVVLVERLPKVLKSASGGKVPQYLLIVILAGFSIKTIARNPNWKNDFTLFQHDVKISKNSAKSNVTAGGSLIDAADVVREPQQQKRMYQEAIGYLDKALEIHPDYVDALLLRGNAQYKLFQDEKGTLDYYFKILDIAPDNVNVPRNIQVILSGSKDYKLQAATYERYLQYKPDNYEMLILLGQVYGRNLGDMNKALDAFNRASVINPNDVRAFKNMGTVYGIQERYAEAIEVLLKAEKIAPRDKEVITNLAITYQRMGNEERAQYYQSRIPR